jgi:HPt (histidine-containing phosphotransfer) domain-containing protein
MDIDYPALLAMFQAEAGENLAAMEEALVGLEHSPDDAERLNTLFRAAHTLKGNADSLGLRPLAELAHALEDLLDLFRGRKLPVTRERIDVLLESIDALRALLAEAHGPSEAAAPEALLARLPAVSGVAVVGYPDDRLGERACAFVTLQPGRMLDLAGVRAHLESCRLTPQYWPERLEVLDELPRTASGKVQKFRLREMAKDFVLAETHREATP